MGKKEEEKFVLLNFGNLKECLIDSYIKIYRDILYWIFVW